MKSIAEQKDGPREGEERQQEAPLVLRLDIRVSKELTKQLIIDRTVEDPWQKAALFCK